MAPRVNAVVRSVLRLIMKHYSRCILTPISNGCRKCGGEGWSERRNANRDAALQQARFAKTRLGYFHARSVGGRNFMHDGCAEGQGHPDHARKAGIVGHELQM